MKGAGPINHARGHWAGGPDPAATPWVSVGTSAFLDGWGGTVLYRLDGNGDTELDGDATGGTFPGTITMLPQAYWPARDKHDVGMVSTSGTIAQVDIWASNGAVTLRPIVSTGGTSGGSGGTVSASDVTVSPTGSIESTNAQAALAELDSEKVHNTRTLTAGTGLNGGGDLSANRTFAVNFDNATIGTSSGTLQVKAGGIQLAHIGDAQLVAIGTLNFAADTFPYFTGATTAGTAGLTPFMRTVLDDTTASTARATLGVTSSLFQTGGAQAIKLDDFATPDDNTDLNSSSTAHGLLLKLDNNTAHYLRGDGTWASAPSGGAVDAEDVSVVDADDHYTGSDVEAILAEIGARLFALDGGGGVDTTPSFVAAGAGNATTGGAGDIAVAFPAGLANGDLLMAHLAVGVTSATLDTVPAGWTLSFGPDTQSAGQKQWIYTKVSDGTETGSETWSTSATTVCFAGRMYAFRDVDASISEGGGQTGNTAGPVTHVDVVTTGPYRLAVCLVAVANDAALGDLAGETGGDWTEAVAEFTTTVSTDAALGLQTAAMASAGTITGGSVAISSGAWMTRTFALLPVGG